MCLAIHFDVFCMFLLLLAMFYMVFYKNIHNFAFNDQKNRWQAIGFILPSSESNKPMETFRNKWTLKDNSVIAGSSTNS